MHPPRLLTALLTLALLGAAPIPAPAQDAGSGARAITDTDLRAAESAKLSLADAIGLAQKHADGGAVLEVRFKVEGFRPTYVLRTYKPGGLWEGSIDANSGELLGAGDTTPDGDLDDDERAEVAGLKAATTALAEAVRTAEGHVQGRAVAGGLEATPGSVAWEVVVVAKDAAWTVVIDARTGQVISSKAKT